MNWHLKRSLRKLGATADPQPLFVRNLRHELVGSTTGWAHLRAYGWKVPAVGFTMFSMAVSATGVYAYSSDAVLPDHPLYSVRQGMEHVEERLAITPTAKVAVKVKHLQRRLQEHELLTLKHRTPAHEPMSEFETTAQRVSDDVQKLPEPDRTIMDEAMTKLEHKRKSVIEKEKRKIEKEDREDSGRERTEKEKQDD